MVKVKEKLTLKAKVFYAILNLGVAGAYDVQRYLKDYGISSIDYSIKSLIRDGSVFLVDRGTSPKVYSVKTWLVSDGLLEEARRFDIEMLNF
jgi:hypothetical protein